MWLTFKYSWRIAPTVVPWDQYCEIWAIRLCTRKKKCCFCLWYQEGCLLQLQCKTFHKHKTFLYTNTHKIIWEKESGKYFKALHRYSYNMSHTVCLTRMHRVRKSIECHSESHYRSVPFICPSQGMPLLCWLCRFGLSFLIPSHLAKERNKQVIWPVANTCLGEGDRTGKGGKSPTQVSCNYEKVSHKQHLSRKTERKG